MSSSDPRLLELLAQCRKAADEKAYRFGFTAMMGDNGVLNWGWGGHVRYSAMALKALDIIREKILETAAKIAYPPRDETLGPDYACYNIAKDPLCFDFIVWLIAAEMTRRRQKAPAPLKVGFWRGTDPELLKTTPHLESWMANVFRPALRFIGAVEDEKAVHGYHPEIFTPKPVCDWSRAGEEVPVLEPTRFYNWSDDLVTITLRETSYSQARNSNFDAWVRFANDLKRQGENVVFVRDTARADEPIPGFDCVPKASRDLDVRLSLYESAKLNFFVSNGVATLGQFGTRPYILFITPEGPGGYNNADYWRNNMGVEWGDQWPWARPGQRMVWDYDIYENILDAWHQFKGRPYFKVIPNVAARRA